jgi:hypothetical protein
LKRLMGAALCALLMVASVIAPLVVPVVARAYVPPADRVAGAIADNNRASGRGEAIRLELTMTIGDRAAVGTGEIVTHPTGLARLELRGSGGLVERHLLQGTRLLVTRNGERERNAPFFLPPMFLLQAGSAVTLRAALESFGVLVDEIGLAPCGDADCFVIGDPTRAIEPPPFPPIRGLPEPDETLTEEEAQADDSDGDEGLSFTEGGELEAAAATEPVPVSPMGARPIIWVDLESYELKRIESADGTKVTFGPEAVFDDVRVPSWIRIEEPDKATVRFDVLRASLVTAPASAFSEAWLDAPPIPAVTNVTPPAAP